MTSGKFGIKKGRLGYSGTVAGWSFSSGTHPDTLLTLQTLLAASRDPEFPLGGEGLISRPSLEVYEGSYMVADSQGNMVLSGTITMGGQEISADQVDNLASTLFILDDNGERLDCSFTDKGLPNPAEARRWARQLASESDPNEWSDLFSGCMSDLDSLL